MDRTPSHETFFSTLSSLCTHRIVTRRVCIKPCSSTCHQMSERLLLPCFVFFLCLSCLYFRSLFYLFSVLNFNLPCCRDRRALNQMRTLKKRNIAPWRRTTLSHFLAVHQACGFTEHWVSMNWKTFSLWYETLGFERDPEQKRKEGPVEDRKCERRQGKDSEVGENKEQERKREALRGTRN